MNFSSANKYTSHRTEDYITIAILSAFLIAGGPNNVKLFLKLVTRLFKRPNNVCLMTLQLNIGDMLVLFAYAASKIFWHISVVWYGGNLMCKFVKFLHVLPFNMVSASLACIGLDRMICVKRPFTPKEITMKNAKFMVAGAWLYAILCSVPQLFIFVTAPIPDQDPGNITLFQCMNRLRLRSSSQINQTDVSRADLNRINVATQLAHMITVFWLPASIMGFCYLLMLYYLYKHYKDPMVQTGTRGVSARYQRSSTNLDRMTREEPCTGDRLHSMPVTEEEAGLRVPNANSPINSLRRFVARHSSSHSNVAANNNSPSRIRKTLMTSVVLMTVYYVCWIPYYVGALWKVEKPSQLTQNLKKAMPLLIVLNSVINPFIYGNQIFKTKNKAGQTSSRQDPSRSASMPLSKTFSAPGSNLPQAKRYQTSITFENQS